MTVYEMRISDLSSDVCASDLFNCVVSAACDVDLANAEQKARGFRNIISNIPGFDKTRLWGVSNTTTVNIGDVQIKNIFGYRDTKVDQQFNRSEEHTSEIQSLMRISYAVFCLKKKKKIIEQQHTTKM